MSRTLLLVANAGECTISTFLVDDRLHPLAVYPLPGSSSTFAVDAENGLVLVGCRGDESVVVTLRLDEQGTLSEIARTGVAAPPAYLTLLPDLLLGASYRGDRGDVWPISAGRLAAPTASIEFPKLHSIVTDPTGRHVYAASLGADLIAQYSLTPEHTLVPLPNPTVAAPKGSGPRHIVIDEEGANAYVITEFSGEVIRFERDRDSGELLMGESVSIVDPDAGLKRSRLGADPRAEGLIWGADIHLSGNGRWLLATERLAGTIATIRRLPDGRLGDVVALRHTEEQPRGFAVAQDGSCVAVAGERSGHVTLYSQAEDGSLHERDRQVTGAGANWLRFVQFP